MIPVLEVGPLFDGSPVARGKVDSQLAQAANDPGFLCIRGAPLPPAGVRGRLRAVFALNESQKRPLYRRKFAPGNRNVYRGWFPLQPGNATFKEGIDIGGDVAYGAALTDAHDPLREPSALPAESILPGWRAAVAAYYLGMEHIALTLMRSLSRTLGLDEGYFDGAFHLGLSTLRLIHYPARSPSEVSGVAGATIRTDPGAAPHYLVGSPHTDSGFLTLLAQDDVGGLQARVRDARWMDVPPIRDTLVVNFGQVLEQWSAGRFRATEHRVLGQAIERYSIPFFYEARADAAIAPLPIDPADSFTPFYYGDFLWDRMTSFVEFRGMENQRARIGKPAVSAIR